MESIELLLKFIRMDYNTKGLAIILSSMEEIVKAIL